MALYKSLPVYKAIYNLLLSVQRLMPNLPRDVRYTIGQSLTKLLMDMILLVYETNLSRDKSPFIRQNRKMLVEAETTIRILCDLHHISEGQYAMLIEQSESISKQLAAWDRSQTSFSSCLRNSVGNASQTACIFSYTNKISDRQVLSLTIGLSVLQIVSLSKRLRSLMYPYFIWASTFL